MIRIKEQDFLIYTAELSAQLKVLYSPPHYVGITAPTSSSHLMQVDTYGDSLTSAVNNPSGVATTQSAFSCIAGNGNAI